MDDCCMNARPATWDERCNPICPAGLRFVDRCAPAPGCTTCGAIDPGYCVGGPCCTDRMLAEIDFTTCSAHCPDGYSFEGECAPDPAARCAAPWLACEDNGDCVLASNTCCGTCGRPELSDFDAINPAHHEAHRESVCPGEPPPCPGCATMPNPDLGATCDSGLCQGFDVRTMDLSACTSDAECRLRVTGCCACGGDTSPYSLIAIRADAEGDYQALVCDETPCAGCEPVYPTDAVEAYCADDGHCAVRFLVAG